MADTDFSQVASSYDDVRNAIEGLVGNIPSDSTLATKSDIASLVSGVGHSTDGQVKSVVFSGGSSGDRTRPAFVDEAGAYCQLISTSNGMVAGDDVCLGLHTNGTTGHPTYGDVHGWRDLATTNDLSNYISGVGNSTDGQVKSIVFSGGATGDMTKPAIIDESGSYHQMLTGTVGMVTGDTEGIGLHTNHVTGNPTYGDTTGVWRDLATTKDLNKYVLGMGNSTDGQVKGLVFSGGDKSNPALIDEDNNYYQIVANSDFSQSIASPGWTKLPNGLIMQWAALRDTNNTFNFPITFPNAVFAVYATNSTLQGQYADTAYAYPTSNSTYFCATKNSYSSNVISAYSCFILAIGF